MAMGGTFEKGDWECFPVNRPVGNQTATRGGWQVESCTVECWDNEEAKVAELRPNSEEAYDVGGQAEGFSRVS